MVEGDALWVQRRRASWWWLKMESEMVVDETEMLSLLASVEVWYQGWGGEWDF